MINHTVLFVSKKRQKKNARHVNRSKIHFFFDKDIKSILNAVQKQYESLSPVNELTGLAEDTRMESLKQCHMANFTTFFNAID